MERGRGRGARANTTSCTCIIFIGTNSICITVCQRVRRQVGFCPWLPGDRLERGLEGWAVLE